MATACRVRSFCGVWERVPELKHAELIDGVVYLNYAVAVAHGSYHSKFCAWLNYYELKSRKKLKLLSKVTLLLGECSLQPDVSLVRGTIKTQYLEQAPDLVIEITNSARSYDLGPKLAVYRKGGVREHLTILLEEERV